MTEASEQLERVDHCPVCSAGNFSCFAVSDGLQIVRCETCALLFSNPRIPALRTRNFFVEDYLKDDKAVDENMTRFRFASLKRIAKRVMRLRPRGGRLLDIGTASGLFPAQFAGQGNWTVEGLEPSRNAGRKAAAKYGIVVHEGFIDTVDLEPERYDVITVLDTFFLEPEPNRMLDKISSLLASDGLVILEIPGLSFRLLKNTGPVARLLYGKPVQLNPAMQMFYYSRDTLTMLMRKHGFKLTEHFPEQSPVYGNVLTRTANHLFFRTTAALYLLTRGRLHFAPKEVLIFRKKTP